MQFKGKIKSKMPQQGLSIFAVMTGLANEHGAINLSQGFPDFDCHPELVELVHKYMKEGHNQYAPMPGVPQLREALAAKMEQDYGMRYHPDTEITITSGATEALYAAITAIVQPGDEVIVFEPYYDVYVPVIRYSGGRPVFVKLTVPDYRVDWTEVQAKITPKTRAVILNNPHNPGTSVFTKEDIARLEEIVSGSDIILISDEVYEHIVFDKEAHHSLAAYPRLAERSMVISSFGKTFHTTGWKMGWCAAPEALTAELRKIHQFITYSVNTPIQHAFAEFLRRRELIDGLKDFYQKKRDFFVELLKATPFKIIPAQGTYFQLVDFSGVSDESEMDFVKRLTIDYGVAAIPLSAFYHNMNDHRIIRFCFAKKKETLEQAVERLCRI
ncbi:MAG TPA: aminotransferase class I/II-fold pyridoxal phosphate-dependent enzyme [Caldithrix abyssi]|uniref:Aminotransferase class I/II-fold pyridoxal phosphate-dependent enzyme n=1 Tax=Caldithrix abyssi TaxID=187145 RepID=A0A7V4TYF9_CALAY|nr:aminotransferase class I/II-fold pyridoxal phosphate-dependent enzyme [Caldithrix abyssi]